MTGKQKEGIFRYLADWSEERKLTWLLAALIIDTVIVYPFVSIVESRVAIQIMNAEKVISLMPSRRVGLRWEMRFRWLFFSAWHFDCTLLLRQWSC
jgi:hypothetical protein